MKISFEGYGEMAATFRNDTDSPAAAGKAASMTGNGTVGLCTGGKPAGIVISADDEYAVVQTGGFVTCAYTGTAPAAGWCSLVGAAGGKVALAGTGVSGLDCLVVEVDSSSETVGFIL